MSHMVIFRNAEGKPGYHQADSLDEAVRFVERLRNQEQVTDSRIFRMQEVPIEFKTYVKVEVAASSDEASPSEPLRIRPSDSDRGPVAMDEAVVVEPVPVGNGQGANRFGRFNKG